MITLFAGADESTFLHELGHLFLMDLDALVAFAAFDAVSAHDRDTTVDAWAQWHKGKCLYSVEALEIKEASRKWNAAYNAKEGVLTSFPQEVFGDSIPEFSSESKVSAKKSAGNLPRSAVTRSSTTADLFEISIVDLADKYNPFVGHLDENGDTGITRERHAATIGCFFRLGLNKLLPCVKIG